MTELYHDYYFFATEHNFKKDFDAILAKYDEYSDIATTLDKLKVYTELLVKYRRKGIPIPKAFRIKVEKLLPFLDCLECKNKPIVKLYQLALALFLAPNLTNYECFKIYFKENVDFIQSEQNTLLVFLMNGLSLIKHPNDEKERFTLYKFGDEKLILTDNGILYSTLLINIIYRACNLKEHIWAENFIIKYKYALDLNETVKVQVLKLVTCYILFAKGRFQDCLLYTSPSPRDLSTSRMPSSA